MAPSIKQLARLLREELDGATVGYPSARDLSRRTKWNSRQVGNKFGDFLRTFEGDVLDYEEWSVTDGSQRYRVEVLDHEGLNLIAEGVYRNRPTVDD